MKTRDLSDVINQKAYERQLLEISERRRLSTITKQQRIKELAAIIDEHLCFIHIIQPYQNRNNF